MSASSRIQPSRWTLSRRVVTSGTRLASETTRTATGGAGHGHDACSDFVVHRAPCRRSGSGCGRNRRKRSRVRGRGMGSVGGGECDAGTCRSAWARLAAACTEATGAAGSWRDRGGWKKVARTSCSRGRKGGMEEGWRGGAAGAEGSCAAFHVPVCRRNDQVVVVEARGGSQGPGVAEERRRAATTENTALPAA